MKRRDAILGASLLINFVLTGVVAYRELNFHIQHMLWESNGFGWATYAGTMQAVADYGNGVRRFYRPTLAKDPGGTGASFTGQMDRGAEVWTWIYYDDDQSRSSNLAFTEAYNRKMLQFIEDPSSFAKNGVAATKPSR